MRLVVTALLFAQVCNALSPELIWSKALPAGAGSIEADGLVKGNAVVLSDDEQSLWVSSEGGGMSVLNATDGSTIASFSPDSLADEYYTESRSHASLHQPNGSVEFAVYAVVDVHSHHPTENSTDDASNEITNGTSVDVSSRVIALHGVDSQAGTLGTMKWSTAVEGIVQGSPLIGTDRTRIYVIHNTALHAMFTVLDHTTGSIVTQKIDPQPMARYGPASLITINEIDQLYWADAHDSGYAVRGRVHTIVSDFLETIYQERSYASSSTMAPTISSDGKSIWLGGRDATVHGWDNTSLKPVWHTQLTRSERNESFPIFNTIEKNDDDSRLFVASASTSFHCINAQNGDLVWSTESSSGVFLSGAQYSSSQNVVYSIEQLSGVVTQYDAETGVSNLYYGDVYGQIHAVSFPAPPTESPSSAPSRTPTSVPSESPTSVPSSLPSGSPTSMPSMRPSASPTSMPSVWTSESPTREQDTASPTMEPSSWPSEAPSATPPSPSPVVATVPSTLPTSGQPAVSAGVPSVFPSVEPSTSPSSNPTASSNSPNPPSEPQQTRGRGDTPTGHVAENWQPETKYFPEPTGTLATSTALVTSISTCVVLVSSILVLVVFI